MVEVVVDGFVVEKQLAQQRQVLAEARGVYSADAGIQRSVDDRGALERALLVMRTEGGGMAKVLETLWAQVQRG